MKLVITSLILLLMHNCSEAGEKISERDVTILGQWMSGSFDSKFQAESDSDYFEIHLHMKPIWRNKKDGVWLYVEQAIIGSLEKPYRQRVYHVYKQNDTTIISHVYTLKNPLRFAGEWEKENPLQNLSVDSLEDRKGCSIYLSKTTDGKYVGSTKDKECESNLRGAAYATSKVTITQKLLESWDQGFDYNSKQVWGAIKGGYKFVKKE
jgi:hypothetical protein